MAVDDFDLKSLAEYLHLAAPQVQKLVERGDLPGRRVGGSWRFNQAEVHHWLENRMGAAGESELTQLSLALDRSATQAGEEVMTLASLLLPEAIAVPLAARTRESVIREMADLAARTGQLWDATRMADALRERENLHPTALDNGVALLHPRRPLAGILGQPLIALGRTLQGIPFGGGRSTPTDIFFLICSTDDRGHLRTLARLSRLIASEKVLAAMRGADNARETYELLLAFDRDLP